jgi:S-adenosylmethionine hydrolase
MSSVTLLSDFGAQDAFVAIAKGILMQHVPGVPIVDISHMVEPFNLQQAAYLLSASFRHFPQGSCHVLLLDVFSAARPRLLLREQEGQYLLAPDNGVLSLAFGEDMDAVWECCVMEQEVQFTEWLSEVGKVVAQLQTHAPADLQLAAATLKAAPRHVKPVESGNALECHVLHIDRYENVVTNLTRAQFDSFGAGRPFRIQFMRNEELNEISQNYQHVPEGEKLCRFNDAGFLEICVNRGKAASLFGLKPRREKDFFYNTIKILFG